MGTVSHTLGLAGRSTPFLTHYTRHLLVRPYRRGLTGGPRFNSRWWLAGYDAAMHLLLDGYAELAGHPLRKETGAITIRLSRLIFAFDDAYEHRIAAGQRPDRADVFAAEAVREHRDRLRDILRPHPQRHLIRAFLTDKLSGSYDHYTALHRDGAGEGSALTCATLDSGGFGECLAVVIGLFHGAPATPETVEQFAAVGILAKLADDVTDFWDDTTAQRPNVLLDLLRQHPEEYAKALAMVRPAVWRRPGWCRRHCPDTFDDLTRLTARHYTRLTTSRLRLAADLILWPAYRGSHATAQGAS